MGGWRRSTWCSTQSCVQVLDLIDRMAVRDSKDESKVLMFTLAEWDAFIAGVKAGEFDRDKGGPANERLAERIRAPQPCACVGLRGHHHPGCVNY